MSETNPPVAPPPATPRPMTIREIAEREGISHQAVCKVLNSALRKLRRASQDVPGLKACYDIMESRHEDSQLVVMATRGFAHL